MALAGRHRFRQIITIQLLPSTTIGSSSKNNNKNSNGVAIVIVVLVLFTQQNIQFMIIIISIVISIINIERTITAVERAAATKATRLSTTKQKSKLVLSPRRTSTAQTTTAITSKQIPLIFLQQWQATKRLPLILVSSLFHKKERCPILTRNTSTTTQTITLPPLRRIVIRERHSPNPNHNHRQHPQHRLCRSNNKSLKLLPHQNPTPVHTRKQIPFKLSTMTATHHWRIDHHHHHQQINLGVTGHCRSGQNEGLAMD